MEARVENGDCSIGLVFSYNIGYMSRTFFVRNGSCLYSVIRNMKKQCVL
ncbi:hypothetical protein SAMN04488156_10851 [Bacillus sp. 166amftsu]|nr:hypothetical protein SAMN04488156_10851 [Bacillus sp. 166amftsu]